ncbi:MAG: NAD-binding protein [SAR324 cluster bacterium]|nr:NAD-binding protein [SAR324 cluster bacterium]
MKKTPILLAAAFNFLAIFSTLGIFFIEGQGDSAFNSLFNSLWWTIVTFTTVGYGDMSPITVEGRIFGMLILAGGVILNSVVISLVSNWFLNYRSSRFYGLKPVDMHDHIMICSNDEIFITSIITENLEFYEANKIVIVSELKEHPLKRTPYESIPWVSGIPYDTGTLKKASVDRAAIAYVSFADDSETVLTVMQVEKFTNQEAITIALDNDDDYHKHLANVGCDYALNPYDIYVPLMVQAFRGPGAPTLIREMILRGRHSHTIESVKISPEFINKPWLDYLLACKKKYGQIPLEMIDEEERAYANPKCDMLISPNSKALMLVPPKDKSMIDGKGARLTGLSPILPTGHILICSDQHTFIRRILVELELSGVNEDIVILSKLEPILDLDSQFNIDWVLAKVSSDKGFVEARVKEAKVAFVDHEQDNHTLMEVIRLENLTDGAIFTIASYRVGEIGDRLLEAGCDFSVNSDELIAPVLSQSAAHQGVGRLIEQIISQDHHSESMFARKLSHNWKECSWFDTMVYLKTKYEYLAMGLMKQGNDRLLTNPAMDVPVSVGDSVLFITSKSEL